MQKLYKYGAAAAQAVSVSIGASCGWLRQTREVVTYADGLCAGTGYSTSELNDVATCIGERLAGNETE